MKRTRNRRKVPSTAIERLEQGRLTEADLRVVARLLDRDDLADAADAVAEANAWADEVERAMRGKRDLGRLVSDDDEARRSRSIATARRVSP